MSTTLDNVREVVLRVGEAGYNHLIDEWPFAERPKFSTEYIIEHMRLALYAIVRYAEQPCKPIQYPADWWQAVKERFAPAWALRKWPVVYTIWEPSVIYPEIALPKHKRFIHVHRVAEFPHWPLN